MNQEIKFYSVGSLINLILTVLKNSEACSSDKPLYNNLIYRYQDYRAERDTFVMNIDHYSNEYHYTAILTSKRLKITDYNNFTVVSIPWDAITAIKDYL